MPHAVVRLKMHAPRVWLADGRTISRHGRFGNLHALPIDVALRLVEAGIAKLQKRRLHDLRADVARLAGG